MSSAVRSALVAGLHKLTGRKRARPSEVEAEVEAPAPEPSEAAVPVPAALSDAVDGSQAAATPSSAFDRVTDEWASGLAVAAAQSGNDSKRLCLSVSNSVHKRLQQAEEEAQQTRQKARWP